LGKNSPIPSFLELLELPEEPCPFFLDYFLDEEFIAKLERYFSGYRF